MPEMAVAMRRAHLDAAHAEGRIGQFADIGGLDRLGEAGPAATRFIFVRRGEERLARDDVDIDARLLVVKILAGSGALGGALLGHAVLLPRQSGYRFGGL